MSFERIGERIAVMSRELTGLLAESFESLSTAEQFAVAAQWETFTRAQAAVGHRLVAELERTPIAELGAPSVASALTVLLRISKTDANRRVRQARELAPRRAMTGEQLEPVLARTAAAQARGQIGVEHVRIIGKFFAKQIPVSVPFDVREAAEAQLADIAAKLTPEELREACERLAAYLHPDGDFSDEERARQRWLRLGRQRADGMREVRGLLDPTTGAALEAVLANAAAPGMNNPADEKPCVDGEPSPEAVSSDTRTVGQRNHDALSAMCRALLASGTLGSHNGLPATMVITTTLRELQSGTGHGVTGGGSLVPMSEVIRQASAAYHYLAVFDEHTEEPLYLGRAKRLATPGQRLVLYAKDRGCTRPGCTAPAYHCQVHHAVADWADDGKTDITDLTLACGPDNRRVKPGGWRTRKRKDGRTEWLPPPQLDTGQARVNNFHHPQRYLIPDDGDDETADGDAE
ncbi:MULTISPECIES: HNH endonuclease signature motif containing protein [unclassified Mycobacterium]|uniref:HNH endonuclease signature motif containing protein n=1 Tax=unclassified Mycobacterium TaxID=2642494 RepID=UPI00073FFE3B|nr:MULTISPECIES: HNH endonuclease signature motif containing protein [unclassified Mycobacterium]KUH82732.1 hypothetical protein AU186_18810 [Mycobacterium sp. GA-1999]KUH87999.1 hypothetical protein AU185_08425 [Mycobacterium sp. GA-0227b]KUH96030.1 hypothetical protein AU187_12315 [Mycobacterium sp. IS-1556]